MRRRTFLARTASAAVAFGILRDLTACRDNADTTLASSSGASPADREFIGVRDRYFLRVMKLNPVTATYLGGDGYSAALHDVNGKLRDCRANNLDGEAEFYRTTARVLGAIDPDALSPAARIDRQLLGAQVAFMVHQLGDLHSHERSVDTYVVEPVRGLRCQLLQMQAQPHGQLGSEEEWQQVVSRLEAIPRYLKIAGANLELGKGAGNIPDRRMVQRDGIEGSRANAVFCRTTLPAMAARDLGARPFATAMHARLAAAGAGAADAYEQFARLLGTSFNAHETVDRFAVGEKEYTWRVRQCLRDPRSVEQLYEDGGKQVALYEAKIVEAAQEVARDARLGLRFGTPAEQRASVHAVITHLSGDTPKSDDELFGWYRDAGSRAVAYARAHALFDIPAAYRLLDVEPTPPMLRGAIDVAYAPAPAFAHGDAGRLYLTPTGDDPAALALRSRASVAHAAVAHAAVREGFPGREWLYTGMRDRAAGISNIRWFTPGAVADSSSMWGDAMATEGWGLYSEALMAEPAAGSPADFYTPAERLYELREQLLRAVLMRVDVGLHTGRMTYDQAKDYVAEHASFAPGACAAAHRDSAARAICEQAERAVYRSSKWPTRAITYTAGQRAIVALREAYQARRGSAYAVARFHEVLMAMGPIPTGYFREQFLTSSA